MSSSSFSDHTADKVAAFISPDDVRGLAKRLRAGGEYAKLVAGQTIESRGVPCRSVAILASGSLRVVADSGGRRELTLYRVWPGEACVLSVCAVLRETAFSAAAIVEEDADAWVIGASTFRGWFAHDDTWRDYVVDLLADRLEFVVRRAGEALFDRVDTRIARYLLRHADATSGTVRVTHGAIAREIGTSREVVTRVFDRLRNVGLIATSPGRTTLVDLEGLRSIAREA